MLTLDEIVEAVCNHYKVTVAAVNSKSRKREYVEARQVAMFMAQKLIKMPASRVGNSLVIAIIARLSTVAPR